LIADPLLAREKELGPSFDLIAAFDPAHGFLFERDGSGVASSGEALRIAAAPGEFQIGRASAEVADALGGIARERDGVVPVAVGAFPFEATGAAELVVPARAVIRRQDGVTREITIGSASPATGERTLGGRGPSAPFDRMQLQEAPSADSYATAVRSAVAMIHTGALRKVVLARTLEVGAGRALDPRQLLHRLRAVDPNAYTFAVAAGAGADEGLLVGASPELLVSRSGKEVRANPLAGSAPRAGDPDEDRANADALAADTKNLSEHAIVVEAVAAALDPLCDELMWDREPALLATPNVWHLSTRFRGVLREPAPSALDLVAALHPTPAVCGDPRQVAAAAIRELEPFERGRYAGPVGWVDADGDGEWAIAIRCARLRADHATLFAGAGIVAGSDPAAEVEETERKFRAFLDALRWG
jgi:isochorismate synthase